MAREVRNEFSGDAALVVQARDVVNARAGGIGNIGGTVGTIITESHGPLHTGSGTQVNRPDEEE